MSEPFIGEIKMFGGNFAPRNYANCDGTLIQISQYTAMFSLLGTIYGGNGQTTFALPDLRSRFPMHTGNGPGLSSRTQGQQGGQETVTLTTNNLPAHTHVNTNRVSSEDASGDDPEGSRMAVTSDDIYDDNTGAAGMAPDTTSSTGSNAAVNNMPPYTVIRFIIAMAGLYPSRN